MTSLQLYAAETTNPNLMQSLTLNTNRSLKRQVLFTKKHALFAIRADLRGGGTRPPNLANRFQERSPGDSRMQQNLLAARALPLTHGEADSTPPHLVTGGKVGPQT